MWNNCTKRTSRQPSDEPAGSSRRMSRRPHFRAVHFEDVGRLVRDIGQVGDAGLHAKRHFILSDAGADLWIANCRLSAAIECAEFVERLASRLSIDTRRVREIQHRVARVAKLDASMLRGQKATAHSRS